MKELEDLPEVILQRILYFTSTLSLGNIAQAAAKWKRLTEDEVLWKAKIHTELTTSPTLTSDQTYKDYYREIYQGIYQGARYPKDVGLGSYQQYIEKNKLSSSSLTSHLYFACKIGAEIWISDLLQKGAMPNHQVLKTALDNGSVEAIELILKNISDIELNSQWQEYSGNYHKPPYSRNITVFHEAVELKNSDIILKRLFEERHRIHVLPELHIAAACGDSIKLIQLLKQGLSINEKDVGKCTALWWAIICGQEECASILISRKADLTNIAVGEHHSALMVAIWRRQIGCLQRVVEQTVSLVEETKNDIFHPVPLTALHKAAEYNFAEGLKLLFKKGLKLNNSKYPFSPLHIAAREGHADCIAILLQQGAVVNQKGKWIDNDQDYKDDTITISTPLGLAAINGHGTCIKLLLAAGADPNIEQERQDIHKGELIKTLKPSVLSQLISRLTRLMMFSYHQTGMCAELSKTQFNLTRQDCPFSKDYLNDLELLLQAGANPNKGNSNESTVLLMLLKDSYSYGHHTNSKLKHYDKLVEKCMELLIIYKVKVDASNSDGQTALHLAAKAGKLKLVQLLVEQGFATWSKPDKEGNTPFIAAAQRGHVEIVKYLFNQGASLEDRNKKGETALMCAEQNTHHETIELLKSFEHSKAPVLLNK